MDTTQIYQGLSVASSGRTQNDKRRIDTGVGSIISRQGKDRLGHHEETEDEGLGVMLLVPEKNSFTPEHAECRMPYMFDPHEGNAEISVVFTWHKKKAEQMADAWRDWGWNVNVGGPAYDDPGGDFIPNKYTKQGVVITHRGCIRQCPWCYVPKREGSKIRCLEVKEGNILQDNNILACPKEHQRKVFKMLSKQKNVSLRGGIDARLLTEDAVDYIRNLHLSDLFLAFDSKDNELSVISALGKLKNAGIHSNKIRCYCLVGFDGDTISDAEGRCLEVLNHGGMPFAQLYDQRTDDLRSWKKLARKWSRPAIYRRFKKASTPEIDRVECEQTIGK